MASLNKVFLIGNLTRDPELRYTPGGVAVATMGLAVNREYKDRSTGEQKKDTCFVNIIAWDRQAENCNQYLSKGRPIFVEGRLQYRAWESEGQKRSTIEVKADRVQFLGRPKSAGDSGDSQTQQTDSDVNFEPHTDAQSGMNTEQAPF